MTIPRVSGKTKAVTAQTAKNEARAETLAFFMALGGEELLFPARVQHAA